MEETYFRMFPLSETHKSWIPEKSLGFFSIFEIFPRHDIQAAVEVFSECINHRLIPNQAFYVSSMYLLEIKTKQKTPIQTNLPTSPKFQIFLYYQFTV